MLFGCEMTSCLHFVDLKVVRWHATQLKHLMKDHACLLLQSQIYYGHSQINNKRQWPLINGQYLLVL